jgi:carboxymethylenebutenolidase
MKSKLLFVTVALLSCLTLSAQDWAKARLDTSPRHGEWVEVKNGARTVRCFIVYPQVKDPAPAVLVIHEIFGLTDWARGVADQLAAAGYIAIAPDLLSGMGPDGGGTSAFSGRDAVMGAVSALPPGQVAGDLNAAADYLKTLPSFNGKLVVAGFCWGGGQSFRFACNREDLKSAFVFYGPPPTDPAQIGKIACPVYGFYGGNDARITASVPKTEKQMQAAGKTYEPVTYEGAGHGFMRAGEQPDAEAANKNAHDEAWERWKKLLGKL